MTAITRRRALVGTAGFSLLASAPFTFATRHVAAGPPIVAVATHHRVAQAFITHLTRTTSFVDAPVFTEVLHKVGAVRKAFEQYRGCAVIGMVGNDAYPVLETLARDAGAAVLCHGRHALTPIENRHVFLTTPTSAGVSAEFMRPLVDDGIPLHVEDRVLVERGSAPARTVGAGGGWIESLAAVYASMATGVPCQRRAITIEPPRPTTGRSMNLNIESFVMRV